MYIIKTTYPENITKRHGYWTGSRWSWKKIDAKQYSQDDVDAECEIKFGWLPPATKNRIYVKVV